MAQFFSQDFGSINKEKKTKLHDWFLLLKKNLEELDADDKQNADVVMQVKRRIVQVGEMLDLNGTLALAQHLQKLETQLNCLCVVQCSRRGRAPSTTLCRSFLSVAYLG